MKEEDDATKGRWISDDGAYRVSFNHAQSNKICEREVEGTN